MKAKLFLLFVMLSIVLGACANSPASAPVAQVDAVNTAVAQTMAVVPTSTASVQMTSTLSVAEQVNATLTAVSSQTALQPTVTVQAPASTQMSEATLATNDFSLKGLRFPAYANGELSENYDLFVESNGRLWQKWLKEVPGSCEDRQPNSVAYELPEGRYSFNGIIADLWLDETHHGKGANGQLPTLGRGNDIQFEVKLPANADYDTAWVLTQSDGGCSSGFDLWYLGPLSSQPE